MQQTRPEDTQYIAHWLPLMKANREAIFTAAAKAGELRIDFISRTGSMAILDHH
jgi:hypothetical protein